MANLRAWARGRCGSNAEGSQQAVWQATRYLSWLLTSSASSCTPVVVVEAAKHGQRHDPRGRGVMVLRTGWNPLA